MSLIVKRLRALPIETRIKLSYGFMDGQTLVISGTIADKDDTAMEILDEQGNSCFIELGSVRFFSLLSQPEQTVSSRQEPADPPKPETRKPEAPQKVLLCRKDIEQLTLGASDQVLKQTFDSLCREEKKYLQNSVDSFFYGVRCGSSEKRGNASRAARRTITQLEEAGHEWSKEACRLVALMLSRVGIWDAELYALAGMQAEAAICGFRSRDYLTAGTHATLALLNPDTPRREDMVTVLAHASAELEDVSALEHLDAAGIRLPELTGDLLLHKQKQPSGDYDADMLLLQKLYPATGIGAALIEREAADEPRMFTGVISKILWVNNTGEITFLDGDEERTVPFRYSSVEDPVLEEKLTTLRTELVSKGYMVHFQLENNEAVRIQHATTPINLAHEALGDEDYQQACWFCRKSIGNADAKSAMALMVDAAASSSDNGLKEQTVAFWEAHQALYPRNSKSLSLLAQLHHALHRLEPALKLTEEALEDETTPTKLRSSILVQYMNYAMQLFNETGSDAWLRDLDEKADIWLRIFRDDLSDEPQSIKRHSKVLIWKIRGLVSKGLVDEAEAVYTLLAQKYPGDSRLQSLSTLICQTRQKLLEKKKPLVKERPAFTMQEEEADDSDSYEVPALDTTGSWEELNISTEDFATRVLEMDGPGRLAPQLTALKVGSMLNPELEALYNGFSAAVNNPLTEPRYDSGTLTELLSKADDRYPELNRYTAACVYLRTAFQNESAPLWLRQCISMDDIEAYAQVLDVLEDFRRQTGHAADRYAAYRDDIHTADRRQQTDLLSRAQRLYDIYIASPVKDNGSFARFAHTKALALNGLKPYLEWVLQENQELLLRSRDAFTRKYLTSSCHVSAEKVDKVIIDAWDSTAKDYPNGESAVLQGSRRNALRSSIRAVAGLVGDYFRHLDQGRIQPRSADGICVFSALLPRLTQALTQLSTVCDTQAPEEASPEEKTGLFLLRHTAAELLDKLSGAWHRNQEQYLFCDFLGSNLVPLADDFLPDFSGMLTGPFGLIHRIFAHAEGIRLDLQAHADRIFSRDHHTFRNFDTGELIRRYGEITGSEVRMPEAERYVNQARLMAKLEFEELHQALREAGDAEGEELLLWFYDDCRKTLRYGFLAEVMTELRNRIPHLKGADAA